MSVALEMENRSACLDGSGSIVYRKYRKRPYLYLEVESSPPFPSPSLESARNIPLLTK